MKVKLVKENYCHLVKRLLLNGASGLEVWLKLEPDKLVMQIALAIRERADKEISTNPTTCYRGDKKTPGRVLAHG